MSGLRKFMDAHVFCFNSLKDEKEQMVFNEQFW